MGLKLECTYRRGSGFHSRQGELNKKIIIPATLKKVGQMVNNNPKIHKVAQNRHGGRFTSDER